MTQSSLDQTLLTRLQAVEDRLAIAELYAKYYWLIDNREWEALGEEIFTADAEMNFGAKGPAATGLTVRGGPQIAEVFGKQVFKRLEATAHYLANLEVVALEGSAATVRRYLQSYHWEQRPDGVDGVRPVDFVGVGVCFDELRKEQSAWRILKSERRSLGPTPFALGSPPQATLDTVFGAGAQTAGLVVDVGASENRAEGVSDSVG